MKFKVLKHKTLADTFGCFNSNFAGETELWQSARPDLLGVNSTIEGLKGYYFGYEHVITLLDDYELVEVELKFI